MSHFQLQGVEPDEVAEFFRSASLSLRCGLLGLRRGNRLGDATAGQQESSARQRTESQERHARQQPQHKEHAGGVHERASLSEDLCAHLGAQV